MEEGSIVNVVLRSLKENRINGYKPLAQDISGVENWLAEWHPQQLCCKNKFWEEAEAGRG